ncbi:MAG: A24 family peptidase [Methyloligellaceae bacterium]
MAGLGVFGPFVMDHIGVGFGEGVAFVQMTIFFVFVGCLIAIAAFDLATYTIPNSISLVLIALFVCAAILLPNEISVLSHVCSFLIVFAVGLVAFRFGAFGGGDVKSWAAVALWFGLGSLPYQVGAIALIGGIFGIIMIGLRRVLASTNSRENERAVALPKIFLPNQPIPYGLAIATGSALNVIHIPFFQGVFS